MECTLVLELIDGPPGVYRIKLDGYRAMAVTSAGKLNLLMFPGRPPARIATLHTDNVEIKSPHMRIARLGNIVPGKCVSPCESVPPAEQASL